MLVISLFSNRVLILFWGKLLELWDLDDYGTVITLSYTITAMIWIRLHQTSEVSNSAQRQSLRSQ